MGDTSGLLITSDTCISLISDLTNELTDIQTEITRESKNELSLLTTTNTKRANIRKQFKSGTEEYKKAMDEIDDNYEFELAKLNVWESQLNQEKQRLQDQIQANGAYKNGFDGMLKQSVSTAPYGTHSSS